MKQALVIPIYQPNEKVLPFLSLFKSNDFALMEKRDGGEHLDVFGFPADEVKAFIGQSIDGSIRKPDDLGIAVGAAGIQINGIVFLFSRS